MIETNKTHICASWLALMMLLSVFPIVFSHLFLQIRIYIVIGQEEAGDVRDFDHTNRALGTDLIEYICAMVNGWVVHFCVKIWTIFSTSCLRGTIIVASSGGWCHLIFLR